MNRRFLDGMGRYGLDLAEMGRSSAAPVPVVGE